MNPLVAIQKRYPPLALLQFYTAFAIFCLGDRGWGFAGAFFFELLGGMRLVGADQFAESAASMVASTWVGRWLDRHNRRQGALAMLGANSLAMATAAALLGACILLLEDKRNGQELLFSLIFIATIGLSILASSVVKCTSDGKRLVYTKDWVVVLANSVGRDVSSVLSKSNSAIVIIDQLASMLGPMIAGFLLSAFGYKALCAVILAWNLITFVIIRFLLRNVYERVPELGTRSGEEENGDGKVQGDDLMMRKNDQLAVRSEGAMDLVQAVAKKEDSAVRKEDSAVRKEDSTGKNPGRFRQIGRLISIYYRQPVFPAAFGLALLYLTVLGFDGFAVGFGRSQGMSEQGIGIYRGISSVFGLMGAVAFWPAEHYIGIRRSGLIGLTLQHLCLWLCVVSIFLPGSPFDPIGYANQWTITRWLQTPQNAFNDTNSGSQDLVSPNLTSINVFFIGLTLSRFGLWLADLAIIQLMQLSVPERHRGTVFGVQNGMSMLFSMLKDVMVVLLPDPSTFGLLIILSIFCVGIGFVQYIHYLIKTRSRKDHHDTADIVLNVPKNEEKDSEKQWPKFDPKVAKTGKEGAVANRVRRTHSEELAQEKSEENEFSSLLNIPHDTYESIQKR